MKKLFTSLFLFTAILSPCFNSNQAFANQNDQVQGEFNISNYSWSHNDEYLFLDIELTDHLYFADIYRTSHSLNSVACEITIYPKKDAIVLSQKGELLHKTTITIQLEKTLNNKNSLDATRTVKHFYSYKDKEYNTAITNSYTLAISAKMNVKPEFFEYEDNKQAGFIAFER